MRRSRTTLRVVPGGGWLAARAAAMLALGLLAACARDADRAGATAAAADPGTRAQMMISAGNQAYHAGDYRLAARRYAAAAVIRNDDPVAYFGLGMALTRLGRDEEARAAYSRARELTQRRRQP